MNAPAWLAAGRDGTPLVLLHGMGSTASVWLPQLEYFGARRRVAAWTMPGYGTSPRLAELGWPALAEALDRMREGIGAARIHLLGHSIGGMVAQEYYHRYPDRVASLILTSTSAGFGNPDRQWQQEFVRLRAEPLREARDFGAAAPALLRNFVGPNIDALLLRLAELSARGVDRDVYIGYMRLLTTLRPRRRAGADRGADLADRRRTGPAGAAEGDAADGRAHSRRDAGDAAADQSHGEPRVARFLQPPRRRFPRDGRGSLNRHHGQQLPAQVRALGRPQHLLRRAGVDRRAEAARRHGRRMRRRLGRARVPARRRGQLPDRELRRPEGDGLSRPVRAEAPWRPRRRLPHLCIGRVADRLLLRLDRQYLQHAQRQRVVDRGHDRRARDDAGATREPRAQPQPALRPHAGRRDLFAAVLGGQWRGGRQASVRHDRAAQRRRLGPERQEDLRVAVGLGRLLRRALHRGRARADARRHDVSRDPGPRRRRFGGRRLGSAGDARHRRRAP